MPLSAADDGDSEVDDEGAATAGEQPSSVPADQPRPMASLLFKVHWYCWCGANPEQQWERRKRETVTRDTLEERFFVVLVMVVVTAQIFVDRILRKILSKKQKSTHHIIQKFHLSLSLTSLAAAAAA